MKRFSTLSFIVSVWSIPLVATAWPTELGQGQMAGRVTETTAILQSRLTQGTALVDGDLPGSAGVGRFEIADNLEFERSHMTGWITASPDYDYIIKVQVADLKPST